MGVFPARFNRFMFLFITFLFGSTLSAADSIHYRLAMHHPTSNLFEVTIIVDQVTMPALDFQMPAWSPGRYVIYDFAHNVQEFRAQGDQNQPLPFEKTDKQTWRVHTGGSHRVAVEYKVFANTLSGTFSQLNDQHANYNGASVYLYVVGMKDRPIDLDVEAPEGWTVINGLPGEKGGGNHWVLQAPNYDILIDCPTEIAPVSEMGPVRVKSFSYAGKSFRVLIHNNGSGRNVDRFVSDLEKIVKTEFEVMGPPDFNQYTFLFHFNPYALHGDGMEHLNSTQIVITGNLGDDEAYNNYLWVSAHEFFHSWNVKRLRPVPLGPWDYQKENYTPSLWISEGITSYYASLSLRRAGLWDDQKYFGHVAGLIEMIQNSSGRFERNVEQASFDTWFWHETPDASNWQNTFLSYYTQGEILGALLELEIRQRTANTKTLDDVFRTLYKKFFETAGTTYYLQGRGFGEEDFLEALKTVSSTDFTDFWKRNIATTAELDYNRYLKAAGLYLDAKRSQAVPYAGILSRENPDHLVVIDNVIPDTPAAREGLSAGDIILAVDGERVNSKSLGESLKEKKSGDKVKFTIYRENRLLNVEVVLGSHEVVTYSIKELENPKGLQKQVRAGWLGRPLESEEKKR